MIFGQTNFAATFDLAALNGTNGFTVNGKTAGDNSDGPPDLPATSMATALTIS